ncbi:MAG TPA: type I secretion protein [Gemmobacter sp.]|nr:type I secretion protein [Gemmobacter sp.]
MMPGLLTSLQDFALRSWLKGRFSAMISGVNAEHFQGVGLREKVVWATLATVQAGVWCVMLGLFAILGALTAGLMLDTVFSSDRETETDDEDDLPEPEEAGAAGPGGDLLDDPAPGGEAVGDVGRDADGAQVAAGRDAVDGTSGNDKLAGGAGDDVFHGRAGLDQIVARGGDDRLLGGGGQDYLFGGAGADSLQGHGGDDRLEGEGGHDLLAGGGGDDALAGHDGADTLSGGAGADSLLGGMGADGLFDGDGDDWLNGGFGDDLLQGSAGQDTLDGDFGDDTLIGHAGGAADAETDFLNGGGGDDLMVIGGADIATGGAGEDAFRLGDWLAPGQPARIMDFEPGADRLELTYDPALHPDPQLALEPQGEDMALLLDGQALALISGAKGMTLADILLVPAPPVGGPSVSTPSLSG